MTPMRLSTILSVLSLLSLHLCFASTDQNVTIDDRNPNIVLSPSSAWRTSDQASGANGKTFSFSSTENASVVFVFPQNVTSISWQGFKRAGPALYSVCLDCGDDTLQAQLVDGRDSDPQSINSVATIFSRAVPPSADPNHTLIITNLIDPRFGTPSQITLDSFILTFPTVHSTPPMYPAAAASISSMPADTSPTAAAYWSNSSPKPSLSTGAIVGIALAASIVLLGAVAATWWFLRRKRFNTAYSSIFGSSDEKHGSILHDPESPMFSTLRTPPRNAEQASMVEITAHSNLQRGKPHIERLPFSSASPLTRSTRAPSIRSASSSILSREPSARSKSAPSEWGTIPVVLDNPFASPHDAESETDVESEFDFSTPLPSSELGSSFTINDQRHNVRIHDVAVPSMISPPAMWRSSPGDSDGERTPTLSLGWRRVEA